jgi:hypothetical protein
MELSNFPKEWDQDPLGNTIHYMRETGFHEWGFVIFRCVYGDDETWDRYIAALLQDVHEDLEYNKRGELEQYARWTVVHDKDLDQAPKHRVREQFVEWRNQHAVWRASNRMSILPTTISNRLPRFTYCLYVDQKCLDTLEAHVRGKASRKTPGLGPPIPPLVAVIIDGDFKLESSGCDGDESRRYPPIDGCTDRYIGWQYYETLFLATMYDRMHCEHLNGHQEYQRPPSIAPAGMESMD